MFFFISRQANTVFFTGNSNIIDLGFVLNSFQRLHNQTRADMRQNQLILTKKSFKIVSSGRQNLLANESEQLDFDSSSCSKTPQ